MMEHRSSFVQQVIHTKLDTALDHPAQGAIMMIDDIIYKKGVVETSRLRWYMKCRA